MNLYLIWVKEDDVDRYDTFDSAVVCAENIDEARHIHPTGDQNRWVDRWWCWVDNPDKVYVKLIGKADATIEKGVVLASFNAA